MPDQEPLSKILNDGSDGGIGLDRTNEGDAAAGKEALTAFTHKDALGFLRQPLVTPASASHAAN